MLKICQKQASNLLEVALSEWLYRSGFIGVAMESEKWESEKCSTKCGSKECSKKCIVLVAAVFVAVFIVDFLAHGILLSNTYQATAHIWRPAEDQQMLFMTISQILFSIIFVFIFKLNYEGKGISEGIRYGLYIGLMLATFDLGAYSYLPIPLMLPFAWILATIVKTVAAGAVLAITMGKLKS